MIFDEGNRDVQRSGVEFDALDGAGRVSCFGECVADLLAEFLIIRKVDVIDPSNVVGVEEEELELHLHFPFTTIAKMANTLTDGE